MRKSKAPFPLDIEQRIGLLVTYSSALLRSVIKL